VSRTLASATAWYAVTLIGGIPGMVITLLVAQVRYHPGFTISPLVVPATLLIVFAGTPGAHTKDCRLPGCTCAGLLPVCRGNHRDTGVKRREGPSDILGSETLG